MSSIIQIKNTALSGSVPNNLTQGELAINVTQGRLFYGSGSANIVKEFTGSGGGGTTNPGGSNTQIQYNNTGTFGGVTNLTWNGTTLSATGSFTGSFTGNLAGTSSYALSSSFATSSSFAISSSRAVSSSFSSNIPDNSVTNAKLVQVATKTFKGRTSSGSGSVEDLSVSTVRTDLSINNVDNTSDVNKPISTATSASLSLKQLKDEFSGLTPISSAALLALANSGSLVIGQVYKVEEAKFYNNLTYVYTYVKATTAYTIDEENALAEFYDPKYDTYNIYDPSLQYDDPTSVIWGGLVWTNSAIVPPGANVNDYELNSGFILDGTPSLYNLVIENVSYSIEFEMIYSRRNHYCNFTCDPAILLIGDVKIRNMQWGNYYNSGTSTGLRGINCFNSDFNIINSRVILLTEITLINSFVAVNNNRILDDLVFTNSGTFTSPNTITSNISSRLFVSELNSTGSVQITGSLNVSGSNNIIGTQTITGNTVYTPGTSPSFNGEVVRFGGGTLTQGQLYFLSSSGTWSLANANSTGSSVGMLGIAAGSSPTTNGLLIRGFAVSSSYTYGTGSVVYMATGSGTMTATSPSSSNHVVRVMGYQTSLSNTIYFDPDKTWRTLT